MALWSRLKSLGGDQILAQFHGRQKSKWFHLSLSDTHKHKTQDNARKIDAIQDRNGAIVKVSLSI